MTSPSAAKLSTANPPSAFHANSGADARDSEGTLPPTSESVWLQRLEQIVDSCRSLREFLGSKALIEAYFATLQEYFGNGRLPRESFDRLLAQLAITAQKSPAVAERLWRKETLGESFSIEALSRPSGRSINAKAWEVYLKRWLHLLNHFAAPLLAIPDEDQRKSEIELIAIAEEAAVLRFERSIAGATRRKVADASREFYEALKHKSHLRSVAAYLILRRVTVSPLQDILNNPDADSVLDLLTRLHQSPRLFFAEENESSTALLTHVKRLLPHPQLLLQDTVLFPLEMRVNRQGKNVPVQRHRMFTYHFCALPRRFHGVWRGVPSGECVGGAPNALDSTTPQRWGTAIIEDSQLFFIERGHSGAAGFDHERKYFGFVHLIPLRYRANGETIACVDLGSTIFRSRVLAEKDPSMFPLSIFEIWYQEFLKRKPAKWSGLAISDSNAVDNVGILDHIRLTPSFALGQRLPAADFVCTDRVASELIGLVPRRGFAREYGRRLICDGLVYDARALTVLRPVPGMRFDDRSLERLRRLVDEDPDPVVRWRSALLLLKWGETEPRFADVLVRGLAESSRPSWLRVGPVLTRLWVENKYTMELWAESIRVLRNWVVDASTSPRNPRQAEFRRTRERIAKILRWLEKRGRTPVTRELASQAHAEIHFLSRDRVSRALDLVPELTGLSD